MDKIYTLVKLINSRAKEELNFVGAMEPTERGAEGCLHDVVDSCTQITAGTDV